MKALAVAAGIVFWTLVLGIAWLAFFPGSESGGPVAVLSDRADNGTRCGGRRGGRCIHIWLFGNDTLTGKQGSIGRRKHSHRRNSARVLRNASLRT